MHAAQLSSRCCWRPFANLCQPCLKLTGCSHQPFAARLHLGCIQHAAHALSGNTLQQDLADVLNEPEGDTPVVNTIDKFAPWQVKRLQEAAAVGRRKVKINELSHELQIPRGDLLKLLKSEVGDAVRKSVVNPPAVAVAGSSAATSSSQTAQPEAVSRRQPKTHVQAHASSQSQLQNADDRQSTAAAPRFQELEFKSMPRHSDQEEPLSRTRRKQPPTTPFAQRQQQSTDYDNKRLSKAVEATLETIYEQSTHPSDEMLQGVFDLHRGVSRKKVIDWLGQRRRADKTIRRSPARNQSYSARQQ